MPSLASYKRRFSEPRSKLAFFFEDQNVDNCDVSCRDFAVLSVLCWKRSGRGGLRTGVSGSSLL